MFRDLFHVMIGAALGISGIVIIGLSLSLEDARKTKDEKKFEDYITWKRRRDEEVLSRYDQYFSNDKKETDDGEGEED